jgi:D-alanyl-D-alanine carboxypeptidase/D-alanyl-D-alanine-endopeptidase (penicillin-binding protein 4)
VALGGEQIEPRLVFHQSAPLGELLGQLGKYSDNFYAEMVFKALGAAQTGAKARSADGASAVASWLGAVGAADAGTRITNGSGLFDANRVSATTLARALVAGFGDPAIGPELVAQLAVGGVDGTLRSRFREYRQSRRVRAKTGTLNDVDALSGYALASDGQHGAAFAAIVSGVSDHSQARRRIDAMVRALLRSFDVDASSTPAVGP